jgi:hypothetical protein
MAVTKFEGGWSLALAGDTATSAGGHNISVDRVLVTKTTNGTVTFRDGDATLLFTTGTLNNGTTTEFDFGGAEMSGFEYDAVSAGSAVVTVFGSDRPIR